MITYQIYQELPPEAVKIREKVFIEEQGFKEEFDDLDNKARHIIIYVDNKPCGTARFYPLADATYQIGRIAILKEARKQKLGSKMLNYVFGLLKAEGVKKVIVGAQVRAINFYLSLGFNKTEKTYLDEGVPHIYLTKEL